MSANSFFRPDSARQKERPEFLVALDRVNATLRKGSLITLLGPTAPQCAAGGWNSAIVGVRKGQPARGGPVGLILGWLWI